jgi:hypothetical protein
LNATLRDKGLSLSVIKSEDWFDWPIFIFYFIQQTLYIFICLVLLVNGRLS